MTATRTVDQKLGDFSQVFEVVKESLTPEGLRALTTLANAGETNPVAIQTGLMAAKIVFANDRAAATVAALLTQSGIKPVALDLGDE